MRCALPEGRATAAGKRAVSHQREPAWRTLFLPVSEQHYVPRLPAPPMLPHRPPLSSFAVLCESINIEAAFGSAQNSGSMPNRSSSSCCSSRGVSLLFPASVFTKTSLPPVANRSVLRTAGTLTSTT